MNIGAKPGLANALLAAFLAAVALLLFTVRLGVPASFVYDEPCYVSSARAFLTGTPDTNSEHPPAGKLLIALGIKTFGDSPFGWRIPGAAAGAVMVGGMFYTALLLTESTSLAMLAGIFALLNHFTYVMARVAMLEVFILMFVVWGTAAWLAAVRGIYPRAMLALAGILLGLSAAVKWSSAGVLGVVLVATLVAWARKGNLAQTAYAVACVSIVPLVAYYLSFWPLCRSQHVRLTVMEVVRRSDHILQFHRAATGNAALNSWWYQWIFRTQPERALSYLVGNWAVCWLGVAALLFCIFRFITKPELPEGVVVALFAGSWLQWAVIARPFEYYYYYSMAATFLCLAIPTALRKTPDYRMLGVRVSLIAVAAAVVVFVMFYPKMAGLGAPWDCAIKCIAAQTFI